MKKIFALSLLSTAALFADRAPKPSVQYADDCCKPCCIPQPKKCIDCECYTPAFYEPNGCDTGLFITADFLYWYARETGLNYAMRGRADSLTAATPLLGVVVNIQKIKHLGTQWSPGYRVGLGYQTEEDGWDLYLNYTWYHNKEKDSVTVPANFGFDAQPFLPLPGQTVLTNPWVNLSIPSGTVAAGLRPYLFNKISAEWSFTLNDLVLELGRKFWLSKHFTLRPYSALRGVIARRSFETISIRNNTFVTGVSANFRDRFNNRYWGVGMELGFQPEWYFTPNFALISNFDGALLWGRFRDKERETYTNQGIVIPLTYDSKIKNNFSQMQPIIDLMIGFRWDETWACERYRTALDFGWEQHIWINFTNQIMTLGNSLVALPFGGNTFESFPLKNMENRGDLNFGGLTIRARFDF